MNRKYLVAITLMMILTISLQSVIGVAIAKKPDNPGKPPPEPEPQNAWFEIQIGKPEDELFLEETIGGNNYFEVVDPVEDYDYDIYATTDPRDTRHAWAHFDGGYGAEPVAFGIYSITDPGITDPGLNAWVDQSVDKYNGYPVIQMLWLWHQWGVIDGETYDHWSICFWWYTIRDPDRVGMVLMRATTDTEESSDYNSDEEFWTINFNDEFTLKYREEVLESRGKKGKGQWVKVNEDIWQGTLSFTVTIAKVSDPL